MPETKPMNPDDLRALLLSEMRTVALPIEGLEWRESESGDGSRILTGYAAIYNQETILYEGTYWTFKEIIAEGAFNNVLSRNPDVHLVIGHDMSRAIARTGVSGIGGLELTSDARGLKVYARLSLDDIDVQCLGAKMDHGIMDQMSFSFRLKAGGYTILTTTDPDTGHETDLRTITEIAELYDVSMVAQGAYPQTEAVLRSLAKSFDQSRERSTEVPAAEGERSTEVPEDDGGATVPNPAVEHQIATMTSRVTLAKSQYQTKEEK